MNLKYYVNCIVMLTVILFLEPYLDRIPKWIAILFIIFLVISTDKILSKIKYFQKSVSKKVRWLIMITIFIFIFVINNYFSR